MIEIKVNTEDVNENLKNHTTEVEGDVTLKCKGSINTLSNELGIALYELFMQTPELVADAIDYMTRHIDKHIQKEEE